MDVDVKALLKRSGGPAAVSRALNLPFATVCNWQARNRVAAKHVGSVSALTGVPLHRIRPDVFPRPPRASVRD